MYWLMFYMYMQYSVLHVLVIGCGWLGNGEVNPIKGLIGHLSGQGVLGNLHVGPFHYKVL